MKLVDRITIWLRREGEEVGLSDQRDNNTRVIERVLLPTLETKATIKYLGVGKSLLRGYDSMRMSCFQEKSRMYAALAIRRIEIHVRRGGLLRLVVARGMKPCVKGRGSRGPQKLISY